MRNCIRHRPDRQLAGSLPRKLRSVVKRSQLSWLFSSGMCLNHLGLCRSHGILQRALTGLLWGQLLQERSLRGNRSKAGGARASKALWIPIAWQKAIQADASRAHRHEAPNLGPAPCVLRHALRAHCAERERERERESEGGREGGRRGGGIRVSSIPKAQSRDRPEAPGLRQAWHGCTRRRRPISPLGPRGARPQDDVGGHSLADDKISSASCALRPLLPLRESPQEEQRLLYRRERGPLPRKRAELAGGACAGADSRSCGMRTSTMYFPEESLYTWTVSLARKPQCLPEPLWTALPQSVPTC